MLARFSTFSVLFGILLIFTIWIFLSPDENKNQLQDYVAIENKWVIEKLKNNEDVNLSGLDLSDLSDLFLRLILKFSHI